ncbi:MAG: WG repeat-containing protein [Lachnospiraceae bacterium]|nr:WG repeat-containing protein [Lachnospiraceae bacterium]
MRKCFKRAISAFTGISLALSLALSAPAGNVKAADEDEVVKAVEEAAAQNENYEVSIVKTDIQATSVANYDGYGSLRYEKQVLNEETGEKYTDYNALDEIKHGLIDNTGKFLFPYKNTTMMYRYYDGVVSYVGDNAYGGYGANTLNSSISNNYENELIRYYKLDGTELPASGKYESGTAMRGGYAVVRKWSEEKGKYGEPARGDLYIVNEKGEIVYDFPELFDTCFGWSGGGDFADYYNFGGYAGELSDGLLWFCTDAKVGDKIEDVETVYEEYGSRSTYKMDSPYSCGFMDINGNVVIPQGYNAVGCFLNGLCSVSVTVGEDYNDQVKACGYIDKTGKIVLPEPDGNYGTVTDVQNAHVNQEYEYLIQYSDITGANEFANCGLAAVRKGRDRYEAGKNVGDIKFGYIDKKGNTVIPFEYDYAFGAGDGLPTVGKDGKYGAVDMNNNVVIPLIFDDISEYYADTIYAIKDETLYIIKIKDKGEKDNTVETIGQKYTTYEGCDFYRDEAGNTRCYDSKGKPVINEFKCDGTYTYYFQLDGTAMKDRLSYHPDGEHVIYFDSEGHEVFSDFANVKKTIAGEDVNDFCFFDVFGYMYVDVLTYDKTGTVLYYANPYGVMEMGKWFQFSDSVEWADGTPAEGIAGGYGYAQDDGTLLTNTQTVDWEGRSCYLQGNGVAAY